MVPNAAASAGNGAPPLGTAPGDRLGADGRYELVERIGSGGMGAVWRAIDHKLGCERAVKVLDARYSAIPAFVKRFRGEATAASRVAHPNVVAVLDVAEEDERPVFLVMELLEGKTLSQLVKGSGRLPWAQVRRYIDQIAAGLGAAHAQEVVHRDVKPGNCLVLPDGQVKILDFGIANVRDEARLTAVGEIIGTCSYMAPEQIRGHVDKRSDIYALGVVAFRLLTGRVPFSHREQDKVLLAHLSEPAPAPSSLVPGLPAGVDELVLRMLAKQPHQRFDGMEELRRVLAGIEHGAPVALEGPTAAPPGKGSTTMFEEAPTRAVVREPVPTSSSEAEPVRVRLDTAPAGSGTLTQLEAQAPRLPGTVLLDEASPPVSGGTVVMQPAPASVGRAAGVPSVVVHGQPAAGTVVEGAGGVAAGAGPGARGATVVVGRDANAAGLEAATGASAPGVAPQAAPPRVNTVPTPTPRPLTGLAASSDAPPRVTRYAAPGESESGGMMRGVLAALGGIALAVAVVAGWVMYTRGATTSAPPAAAPAAAIVGDEADAAAEGDAAIEPGLADASSGDAAPGEASSGELEPSERDDASASGAVVGAGGAGGDATEGATTPVGTSEAVGGTPAEGRSPVGDGPVGEGKPKKRRPGKPKTGETKTGETTKPEPQPEPTKPKGKPGDLRDPF